MNEWYPTQDAIRAAVYANFIARSDQACALLGASPGALYRCRPGKNGFALPGSYNPSRMGGALPSRVPGQPAGSQSATLSAMMGDQPLAALTR